MPDQPSPLDQAREIIDHLDAVPDGSVSMLWGLEHEILARALLDAEQALREIGYGDRPGAWMSGRSWRIDLAREAVNRLEGASDA